MKQIPLTQGQFALVDDSDYDFLNKLKWYAHYDLHTKSFRAIHSGKRKKDCKREFLKMHRYILNITDSKIEVDHIDHDTLNNQRSNLRIATRSQNGSNKRPKNKYLGVSWHKLTKKWHATIGKDKKDFYLGLFVNQEDAARAYNEAAKKLHGEFANLNVVD